MSAVVKAVEKVVSTVVDVVEAVINDPLPTLATIGLSMVGIPPYVTQAAITAARGGDLEDIAKSAAIAYATPAVAAKIAPAVGSTVSTVVTNEAAAKALTAATSQSLVAGSLTAATGGDWQQAAAGAFAGSMAASGYDEYVAPKVMAQAQSLGLSAESHANIQNALKSSVASGTGAAAAGGDFATGFANAFVESGFETLSAKADQGLQDMKKSFLKDKGMQDNEPTRAGIPSDMVPEVPESPEGKYAQKNSVSIEDQLDQIAAQPKNPYLGRQLGDAFATTDGISGLDISAPSNISSLKQFEALEGETGTPVVKVKDKEGVVSYQRDIKKTDASGKETGYTIVYDPEFNQFYYEYGNVSPEGKGAEVFASKTRPGTTLDDLKRGAFSGNTSDLSKLTEFGQLPSGVDTTGIQSGALSSGSLSKILSQANKSSDAAVEAKAQAAINPTPENIAAAEQAQLTAELDQKVLADAQKQISVEEVPPTGEVPPQSANAPVASNVPAQPAESATPTINQTNERILYSILSGNATTGAPTPVQGQTGADASGLSPLQQAGIADVEGAGGISDPIGGQIGKIGTLTGGTRMPGTGGSGLSLNAPSGGLQFSSFGRTGYAPQQTNLVGSLIPNLLTELNNQSLMMMSPEEYALRTQAGNIFRVARGGLITLKKQR